MTEARCSQPCFFTHSVQLTNKRKKYCIDAGISPNCTRCHLEVLCTKDDFSSPDLHNGDFEQRDDNKILDMLDRINEAPTQAARKRELAKYGSTGLLSFCGLGSFFQSHELLRASGPESLHQRNQGIDKRLVGFMVDVYFGTGSKIAMLDDWLAILYSHGMSGIVVNHDLLGKKAMTGSERNSIVEVCAMYVTNYVKPEVYIVNEL